MNHYTKEKRTGFTLIELLVVVSLIGVLATLVLANLNAARQRGRDVQRKGDLRNIQTALRVYYNDYNKYPGGESTIYGCGESGTSECEWGIFFESGVQTYMSILPDDPLPDVSYSYQQIDADNYILTACLENPSDEKGKASATCSSGWEYAVQP
jgi:general secretion pathway protein G